MKDMNRKERNETALRGSISAAEVGNRRSLFITWPMLIEICKYKRQFIGDPKRVRHKNKSDLLTADLTCSVFSARTFRI